MRACSLNLDKLLSYLATSRFANQTPATRREHPNRCRLQVLRPRKLGTMAQWAPAVRLTAAASGGSGSPCEILSRRSCAPTAHAVLADTSSTNHLPWGGSLGPRSVTTSGCDRYQQTLFRCCPAERGCRWSPRSLCAAIVAQRTCASNLLKHGGIDPYQQRAAAPMCGSAWGSPSTPFGLAKPR